MIPNDAKDLMCNVKSLNAPGAKLTYYSSCKSEKPVLVFIPGWGGSFTFFQAQLQYFRSAYRVILVDYPGFGASTLQIEPAPSKRGFWGRFKRDKSASLERQAELVRRILKHENVESCILIGHSIGGALALTIAAEYPELVHTVIGIDSMTYVDVYSAMPQPDADDFLEGMREDFVHATHTLTDSYFLPSADPSIKSWVTETMISTSPKSGIAILEAFLCWDLAKYLELAIADVHVIAAEASYDESTFTRRFGKRVSVSTIPNVGHFVMLDDPAATNSALSKVLSV